jgi:hypothetical protein
MQSYCRAFSGRIIVAASVLFVSLQCKAFADQIASNARQEKVPTFEDYKVTDIFRGVPAKIDPQSHPWARRFKTVLSEGAGKGPNFAGHYRLIDWGCGTSCIAFAIVDVKTGRVFAVSEANRGVPAAGVGFKFQIDSKLLIVDPIELLEAKHPESGLQSAEARFYLWDKNQLSKIYTLSPTRPDGSK